MKPFRVELQPSRVQGTVTAPASKSETHRAFLLAAQASDPCTIQAPLLAADTRAMLRCLLDLGARVHLAEDGRTVQFLPAVLRPALHPLDCGNSGTALRLLAATAARFAPASILTGDDSLRRRPSPDLLHALTQLGATIRSNLECAPIALGGPIRPGVVHMPSGGSSQFTSALLLSLPFLSGPSQVHITPPIASEPYLNVTLAMARRFQLQVTRAGAVFHIEPSEARAANVRIGGDWSSAAFMLGAAAVTQGSVKVTGLELSSAQGDQEILRHLQAFGAKVTSTQTAVHVAADRLASPGTVDLRSTPDLFPILAVVAATARGTTTFTGGTNLRHKESDRITAMAQGLRQLGAVVQETPDGLVIEGRHPLRGATLASHGDHRIHMALAVAALAAQGPSTLDDPACCAVSYPGFHADLSAVSAKVRLLYGHRAEVSP